MTSIFDIAGSGMSAQTIRLNTTASNLANADTVSSSEAHTYRARKPIFAAAMSDATEASAAVKVLGIVEDNTPLKMEHNPNHPLANADGYIFRTNVNPMQELADMIEASRSYQVNVDVMENAKTMLQKTLTLGQ